MRETYLGHDVFWLILRELCLAIGAGSSKAHSDHMRCRLPSSIAERK